MKQSRCWKAGMAAVLIVAGLSILPREGAAWSRYTDPIDPVLFGEPDVPVTSVAQSPLRRYGVVFGRILIVRAGTLPMVLVISKEAHQHRMQSLRGSRR